MNENEDRESSSSETPNNELPKNIMFSLKRFYEHHIARRFHDPLLLNASYIFFNNVLTAFGGFLFWYLAAKLFPQDQVGLASSQFSAIALISGFALFGFGAGLVKFLSKSENPIGLINSSLLISSVASLLISLIYLFLLPASSEFSQSISGDFSKILSFSIFVLFFSIFNLLVSAFIGYRKAKYGFYQHIIFNLFRLGLLLFFGSINPTSDGILNALLMSLMVSVIVIFVIFIPRMQPNFRFGSLLEFEAIKEVMIFSFGSYISNNLFLAPSKIAPIMALEFINEQASANIYIAWLIAVMVMSPGVSFGISALAEGSFDPTKSRSIIIRSTKMSFLITLPLMLLGFFLGERLLGMFGMSLSDGTIVMFKVLMISSPLAVFSASFLAWLRILGATKELVIVSLVIAVSAITFPLIMAETMGPISFGLGWLLGNILILIYGLIKIGKDFIKVSQLMDQ